MHLFCCCSTLASPKAPFTAAAAVGEETRTGSIDILPLRKSAQHQEVKKYISSTICAIVDQDIAYVAAEATMSHTKPLLCLTVAVPGGSKQLLLFDGENEQHLAQAFVEDNALPDAAVPLLQAQLQQEAQVARAKLAQAGQMPKPRVQPPPATRHSPVAGIATSPIYPDSDGGAMLLQDEGGSVSVGSMGDALSASGLAAPRASRPHPTLAPLETGPQAAASSSNSGPRLLAQDAVARELQFNAVREAAAAAALAAAAAASRHAAPRRKPRRSKALPKHQPQPPVYARLIRDSAARAAAAREEGAAPSGGPKPEPGQDPAAAALQLREPARREEPGDRAAIHSSAPVWREGARPRFAQATAAAAAKAGGAQQGQRDPAAAEAAAASAADAAAPWTCARCGAGHSGSQQLCTAALKWGQLLRHRVSGQLRPVAQAVGGAAPPPAPHTCHAAALPHYAFPPLSSVLRGEGDCVLPPPSTGPAVGGAGGPPLLSADSARDAQHSTADVGDDMWQRVCGTPKPHAAHVPAVSAPADAAAREALTAAAAARHAEAQARVAALGEAAAAARLAECTFAPQVGARSAALAAARVRGASLLQRLALPAPVQPPQLPSPQPTAVLSASRGDGASRCSVHTRSSAAVGVTAGSSCSSRAPLTNRGVSGRAKAPSSASVCSALYQDAGARRQRRAAASAAADAAAVAAAAAGVRGLAGPSPATGVAANDQLAHATVSQAAEDLFSALRATAAMSGEQRQQWLAAAGAGDSAALAALLRQGHATAAAAGVPSDALPPAAAADGGALWLQGIAPQLQSAAVRGAAAGHTRPAFVLGVAHALAQDAATALGKGRATDVWGAALGQLRRLKAAPGAPTAVQARTAQGVSAHAVRSRPTLHLVAATPPARAAAGGTQGGPTDTEEEAPLPETATFVPAVNPRSAAMVAAARRGTQSLPVHERLLQAGAAYRRRAVAAAAEAAAAQLPQQPQAATPAPTRQPSARQKDSAVQQAQAQAPAAATVTVQPAVAPTTGGQLGPAPVQQGEGGGLDALQAFDVAALLALTADP